MHCLCSRSITHTSKSHLQCWWGYWLNTAGSLFRNYHLLKRPTTAPKATAPSEGQPAPSDLSWGSCKNPALLPQCRTTLKATLAPALPIPTLVLGESLRFISVSVSTLILCSHFISLQGLIPGALPSKPCTMQIPASRVCFLGAFSAIICDTQSLVCYKHLEHS